MASAELKSRFKAKPDRLQSKPIIPKARDQESGWHCFPIPSLRIPLISRRSERLHQRTSIAYRNQGSERRERTDGRLLGRLARLARAKLRRLTYIRIYTDDTCVHMLCTSTLDLCICARSLYIYCDSVGSVVNTKHNPSSPALNTTSPPNANEAPNTGP